MERSRILPSILPARIWRKCSGLPISFLRVAISSCDGRVSHYRWGKALKVNPGYGKAIDRRLAGYYDHHFGYSRDLFAVKEHLLPRADAFAEVACAR